MGQGREGAGQVPGGDDWGHEVEVIADGGRKFSAEVKANFKLVANGANTVSAASSALAKAMKGTTVRSYLFEERILSCGY